jgi:hypothetical protein
MQQALVEELSSEAAAALEHHTLHASSILTTEQVRMFPECSLNVP